MESRRPLRPRPVTAGVPASELERLYRALAVRLMRRATWRYRLVEEDAKEVVHEVFALALVKLNDDDNAPAWLYATLDNLAVNRRRKDIRRRALLARWGGPGQAVRVHESREADGEDGDGGDDVGNQ